MHTDNELHGLQMCKSVEKNSPGANKQAERRNKKPLKKLLPILLLRLFTFEPRIIPNPNSYPDSPSVFLSNCFVKRPEEGVACLH